MQSVIHHSQPFVSPNLTEKIGDLISEKNFASNSLLDKTVSLFKSTFHQENFYFTQSGSQALYWILSGLDLSKDDEVILPSYVCHTVYTAVEAAGAKPVLCDIGSDWLMSPKVVEQAITKNTKAIIIVNLYGMYLDCSQFRFPGIVVINDLCQALDVLRDTNRDHGDFIFYSFHPTKFLTAGSGGGFSQLNTELKFNNRLSESLLSFQVSNINLLILEEQLKLYDSFISRRRDIANIYFSKIQKKHTGNISVDNNSFFRFPLEQKVDEFDAIQSAFMEEGIHVRRGVDELIHRTIKLNDRDFPNTTHAFDVTVSIPIYPSLQDAEAERIAVVAHDILGG